MSRNSRKRNQQRKKKGKRGATLRPPGFIRHVPDKELIATDADLQRPDALKYKYATFASAQPPGKGKLRNFKAALGLGRLGNFTEIDHWAIEEFFWHGVPGDDWHPMDAYLTFLGDRVGDEIKQILRRWKEAQIGCWQIDGVIDSYLTLRPWSIGDACPTGEQLRAISLSLGGAQQFADAEGKILIGYLAPWHPERGVWCFMGYGMTMATDKVWGRARLLGLRQPHLMAEPLAWEVSEQAFRRHLQEWKRRDWYTWLAERVTFPFLAATKIGVEGKVEIVEVTGLVPMDEETRSQLGIYFEVPIPGGPLQLAGASTVEPLDVTSPDWLALAEYGDYREEVGPPPGMPPGASTIVLDRKGRVTWH